MGFKVYQAEVKDANLLPGKGSQDVFVSGSGDKITVRLNPPASKTDAQPVKQSADNVIVFVNENGAKGRDIIVAWDTPAAAPAVSVPRGGTPTTVATPSPGQWLVTKDDENIQDGKLDAAYQAVLPSGWQKGSSVKFKASNCGLDNFVVTYRFTLGGKRQCVHVVISVHKRLHCHLFEMKRSAGSPDTISDFRKPLEEAVSVFAGFGIDLVFPNDKIEPEGTTNFFPTRNNTQLKAMIPASTAAGRSPSDLWINVVNAINGTEDGLGGQSQVHVETKKNLDAKRAYESWEASWQQAKARGKTRDQWLNGLGFSASDRKLARELALEATTADDISRLNMRTLILHEIGHALGLVPLDEKAGGTAQSSWQDSTHQGHCSTKTCAMYWESGSATLGFAAQLGSKEPFDHVPAFGPRTKNDEAACMLFLRACDLSDLRNLPQ